MAIQWQSIDIPFLRGRDGKTDPKVMPPGTLEEMINCYVQKTGSLRERNGYSRLSDARNASGEKMFGLRGAASYETANGREDLVSFDGHHGFVWDDSRQLWRRAAPVSSVDVRFQNVDGSNFAFNAGLSTAYCCGTIAMWAAATIYLIDEKTRTVIKSVAAPGDSSPFMLLPDVGSNRFVTFGLSGANIKQYILDLDTMTFDSGTNIITDYAGTHYDLIGGPPGAYYVTWENTSNQVVTQRFDIDTGAVGSQNFVLSTSIHAVECLGMAYTPNGSATDPRLAVFARHNALQLYCSFMDENAVDISPGTFVAAVPSATDITCIVASFTDDATECQFFALQYDYTGGADRKTTVIFYGSVLVDGSIEDAYTEIARGFSICSRPIRIDDKPLLHVSYTDNVLPGFTIAGQASYFLIDIDGYIVARWISDDAVPASPDSQEVRNYFGPAQISERRFAVAAARRVTSSIQFPTFAFAYSDQGVAYLDFDTVGVESHVFGSIGMPILGHMCAYDGYNLRDAGFPVYPNEITATGKTTTGLLTASGVYQVVAVYYWRDRSGREWYSTPSAVVQKTLVGGENAMDVVVPTLRAITAEQVTHPVQILLYRTKSNGSLFYLEGSAANDPTVHTVTIEAILSDSTLGGNLPLYTTGGILQNSLMPGVYTAATDSDRMFIVPTDKRDEIWPSKPLERGIAPEFSSALATPIPTGGDIIAVKPLDANIIVYKAEQIRAFSGDGPNAAGQGSFSRDALITTTTGCTDKLSVVSLPNGHLFKGKKGWWLLSRALETAYIGGPIEDYNGFSVSGTALLDDRNLVIITLVDSDDAIVYDYEHDIWGTWNNHLSSGVIVWRSLICLPDPRGGLLVETPDRLSDDGRFFGMKVRSGWMNLAGLQGFLRARWCHLLGDRLGGHKLAMRLYVNPKGSTPDVEHIFDNLTPDDDDEWLEKRGRFATQVVTGFKVELEVIERYGHAKALSLTGVAVEYGSSGRMRRRVKES